MAQIATASTAADASPQRRAVRLAFDDSDARWNPRHEQFAYLVNAISTLLPYLERHLVASVEKAATAIPDSQSELHQEMADFCYQERRHNANHVKFNKMIARFGYEEELAEGEIKLKKYYDKLATRGDRFGLAWSEGFETVAPFVGIFMFENADEFGLADWSDPTNALWLWHMSEEFEHRTVCNYAYKTLYDHYPTRIHGLWSATIHLFVYSAPVAWKMAQRDWADLPLRQRLRNQGRFASMLLRMSAYIGPRLIGQAMRPSYNPAALMPPDGMQALLDQIAEDHGIASPSSAR